MAAGTHTGTLRWLRILLLLLEYLPLVASLELAAVPKCGVRVSARLRLRLLWLINYSVRLPRRLTTCVTVQRDEFFLSLRRYTLQPGCHKLPGAELHNQRVSQ